MPRVSLKEFLSNKNVQTNNTLPFVHTTYSIRIDSIAEEQKISSKENCQFFNEKLIYLFVGRPAYKWNLGEEAQYWTLPTVFIWNALPTSSIKRIFPFDSGAFKKNRFPDYLTMIPLEEFELGRDTGMIDKVISTFFDTKERYFNGIRGSRDLVEKKSILRPEDVAAAGLSDLYSEKINDRFDDRARAIEVQVTSPIKIDPKSMLGIVAPIEYKRSQEYDDLLNSWSPIVEYYDILPYRSEAYYLAIHSIVKNIYRNLGLIHD